MSSSVEVLEVGGSGIEGIYVLEKQILFF